MTIIWGNVWSWPNRVMARYLRRRGWVCFYLDERSRECRSVCWMQAYSASERAKSQPDGTPDVKP